MAGNAFFQAELYNQAIRQTTGGDARQDGERKRIGVVGGEYLSFRFEMQIELNQIVRCGFVWAGWERIRWQNVISTYRPNPNKQAYQIKHLKTDSFI